MLLFRFLMYQRRMIVQEDCKSYITHYTCLMSRARGCVALSDSKTIRGFYGRLIQQSNLVGTVFFLLHCYRVRQWLCWEVVWESVYLFVGLRGCNVDFEQVWSTFSCVRSIHALLELLFSLVGLLGCVLAGLWWVKN